ncbi:uncharacterized protein LOC127038011 [Gopherus flavomarginatus]|uniref:uncharacterized protein LOC127038011 n=1 Tax=Gopherus flavomarginatus TaxID=286002 RepID=UPI0021CBB94D|nr:uncharacterized protein LOC127038011 [Gopherus flavomarginatus]XP_050786289.1 uncharacterized protein LOC127038011 [Gopherus flavomarginatus]
MELPKGAMAGRSQELDFKLPTMSKEDLEELQDAIDRGNLSAAASKVQESLELLKNARLDIAIMGEAGAGKSSFINAIRGLKDDDQDAAMVGILEMTMERFAYSYPKLPNVRMWDLPGIGISRFRPDLYLQQVNFAHYDFFIILVSHRFRSMHADLVWEIQRMGKKFYYVHSKVDMDLCNERRKKNFSQEDVLQRIRSNCIESLQRQGVSSPQVFLISRWEFDKYDGPRLQEALADELDAHKRHVFLLGLSSIFRPIFDRKMKVLQGQVRVQARTISASLIPGLSIACDVPQLMGCMASYCKIFGLDDDSLVNLAQRVGKPVVDLRAVIRSPIGKEISSRFTLNLLAKARADCMTRTRHILSAIPLIGGLVEAQMAFSVTCTVLQHFLDNVAEDAQRVLIKALEVEEKKELDATGEASSGIFLDLDIKLPSMSEEEFKQLKAAIQMGSLSEVVSKLEQSKTTKLNVAITGESGCGKSSFINAMLGLDDDDKDAAKVDVVETTMEPTPYPHPKHPNITMWELPGIGMPSFRPDRYLQQVNFACYDFFIIIASERFRSTHADLAQEIHRLEKKFFFVRSKVDVDLQNEKSFSEGRILQKIRDDCVTWFQGEGMSSPQVFLVSRWEFGKYDSPQLQETLADDLDLFKRHVFLLSLPNISRPILERKKKALQGEVWKQALVSCTISAIPIPGLPVVCDIPWLMGCMASYRKAFDLDDDSLVYLAKMTGKPIADLRAVVRSPLTEEISKDITLNLLAKAKADYMTRTKRILSGLPLVGTSIEAELSFWVTYTVLRRFLDDIAEDAQTVLTKALDEEEIVEMAATEEASRSLFQDLDVKVPGMSEKEVEELKAAIETGSLSEAAQKAQEALELSKNTNLNIAVTGESGSGKSSFINAMLGLADDDKGAAEVGIIEITTEPIAYLHPTLPNVKMWDLPGIGTPSFRPDTYFQQVSFARYDFFIIVTSKRFSSCNADLAQEIQKMGKKFYFVRSKVDEDLRNESRKRNYDQETILQKIRDDCVEKLRSEGVNSPQVFLISRWEFDQYDSPQLQETLANELDSHKRHIFLLALPNISRPILDKKKEALRNQIWKRALKSCAIAAVPIPHLSVSCDVDILVESMTEYCKVFGLDEESLDRLSKQVKKPVSQLKGVIKTPLAKELSREDALELLGQVSGSAVRYTYSRYLHSFVKSSKPTDLAWEQGDKEMGETMIKIKKYISLLPVCGTLLAAEISFLVTAYALHYFLDGVAEDAHRVLTQALEVAEKKSV